MIQWFRRVGGLRASPEPAVAPLGHLVLADVYNRRGEAGKARIEEARARKLQAGGAP